MLPQVTRKSLLDKPEVEKEDGESPREHRDVFMWGYNAYGELGLGQLILACAHRQPTSSIFSYNIFCCR